jgi:hypothetical protein
LVRAGTSIRLDEQRIDAHEHALADFEAGGPDVDLPGPIPKHQLEADRRCSNARGTKS